MTVKELIDILKEANQRADVLLVTEQTCSSLFSVDTTTYQSMVELKSMEAK